MQPGIHVNVINLSSALLRRMGAQCETISLFVINIGARQKLDETISVVDPISWERKSASDVSTKYARWALKSPAPKITPF